MTDGNDRDVIEAQRRRKGGGKPQGRAEAPIRRQPDSGQGGGTPRPSGGGVRMPSLGGIGGCGTVLILILLVGYFLLSGGGGLDFGAPVDQPYVEQPYQEQPQQAAQPQTNFTPPIAAGSGQTWLVMLYQDADDQILEKDIYIDLNEAERVGSSENVHIVAQIDRFQSGFSGDGDWTSARRYYVTQDDDLARVGSQLVSDLGEADMGSGEALVDFITWAVANFPADRYLLIMSDHGLGWPGGWSDPSPGRMDGSRSPLASRLGQNIYLNELDQALGIARQQAGIDKFDLIGMDACLMSQLEVYAALQPHARVAVASEEVEPSLGWAYVGFLDALISNPGMSAEDVGRLIVQSYIREDQRITDAQARADFLRGGSPLGGFFGTSNVSASQLAAQMEQNVTLTAVDLEQMPDLMAIVNDFVYALQGEDQSLVAQARSYAQSYTSIFGKQVPPAYIDLGHFAALLGRNTRDGNVSQAAEQVLSGLSRFVIAEKHGAGKPGSTGVAIYFPNSTLYSSPLTGPQSYTEIAERFAATSLWDDFLAFHYHDRSFSPQDAVPVVPSGGPTRAPGQGSITVSEITASSSSAAPDQPVRLSVDISGQNIGYIYLFVGYYDSSSNSIYVADTDYLESPNVRELNGVYYPEWSEDFTLAFNWDPIVFSVSDGTDSFPALFSPENYGLTFEEATYSVEGLYTFADTGDALNARLYFQNGALIAVYGFTGADEAAAPREIAPQPGDRFTLFEKWLDLASDGSVRETAYLPGQTLTFGSTPFTWEQLYAAQGEYIVGFIIADLDGNQYPVYTRVTVR
ncbi:MAG: hypothetical protein JW963_16675 [Anaerolineales bacterium]|nr:hypothetical protein [Anaerolineales bacterium]